MQNRNTTALGQPYTFLVGPASTTSVTPRTCIPRDPRKCLFAVLNGGGGGGSSGWADVAGATDTGGGGGGAGGDCARIFAPSYLLPGGIEVRIGQGGAGGAGSRLASNAGLGGTSTGLFHGNTYPSTSNGSFIYVAGAGGGGQASLDTSGGLGGNAGGTAATAYGITTVYSLSSGTQGNTNTTANTSSRDISISAGGCGGGGITTTNIAAAGGGYFSDGLLPAIAGPTANGALQINTLFNPLVHSACYGGTGGGSSTATGGNGGPGGLGCGGGGSGASNSAASNSGAGGAGGPGFAILIEI